MPNRGVKPLKDPAERALELLQEIGGCDYHCVAGRLVLSREYQEALRILMMLAKI